MALLKPAPPASEFDPAQLKRGTLVELEHTDSWNVAEKIARHHLAEDRSYYRKLARFHKNMKRNPTFYTSRDDGHYHTVEPEYVHNVDWGQIGKRALVPLSGIKDDDFTPNPSGMFWTLLSAAGAGLSSYHGYKRNVAENPIAWALWWGLWGSVLPIITLPIAIAQGYAEPAE
jgi:hypothetical protein